MDTALKVLFISLRADLSGGPKHLYDQLAYIKHSGSTIEPFVAAPDRYYFSERYKALSTRFFTLEHRSFRPLTAWRLLRFCRSQGIRLVHSHGRGAGLYSRFLHLFGIRIVHTFHGIHLEGGFKTRLKFILDLMTRDLVDQYVCVSRTELERAIASGLSRKANINLIENGIALETIQKTLQSDPTLDLVARYNLKANTRLLGTIARNDPVKGVDSLVKYVSRFKEQYPEKDIALFVVGGGYAKFDGHGIFYLGEIDDMVRFCNSLDIYVSNSRAEGMPLSVLEAMACGTPCLLSRVTGHTDLVTDGTNGFLFAPHNFESFAGRLLELLSSGGEQQAVAALKILQERHTLAIMSEKTLQLYDFLVRGPAHRPHHTLP